jgi:hypothetical protein
MVVSSGVHAAAEGFVWLGGRAEFTCSAMSAVHRVQQDVVENETYFADHHDTHTHTHTYTHTHDMACMHTGMR